MDTIGQLWKRQNIVFVFIAAMATCQANADTEFAEFTVRRALNGWNQLYECYMDRQAHVTITSSKPQETPERLEYSFNGRGRAFKCEWSHSASPAKHVVCANSKYGFALIDENGDGKWAIEQVSTNSNRVLKSLDAMTVTSPSTTVFMFDAAQLVANPSFLTTDISPIELDGQKAVRVRFKVEFRDKVGVSGGEFVLLPDKHWAIKSYQLQCNFADGKSNVVGGYDYGIDLDGCPMPTRHYYRIIDNGATAPLLERQVTYSKWSAGDIDESMCTLAAFGLPEFEYEGRGARYYWIVVNGFIVLLLVIAVLLRRLAMRVSQS